MSAAERGGTPMTDAVIEVDCGGDDYSPLIEFAREQEREIRKIQDFLDSKDMVPRSRLNAVEAEMAQVEQTLKDVQKYGHAEITKLTEENKRFREALAWIANLREPEYVSKSAEHARKALVKQSNETPWADLQLRVPDGNCLLEGSRGPQCRYCGEVYADPITDDGHSRNCNRPKKATP